MGAGSGSVGKMRVFLSVCLPCEAEGEAPQTEAGGGRVGSGRGGARIGQAVGTTALTLSLEGWTEETREEPERVHPLTQPRFPRL